MRYFLALLLGVLFLPGMGGCGWFKANITPSSNVDIHELVYDYPLDYTYLVVIEAITELSGWDPYMTDKTAGKIQAIDTRYSELLNPDDRVITIWLTSLAKKKTSVKLDKDSERKLGAKEVLDAIDFRMSRVTSTA